MKSIFLTLLLSGAAAAYAQDSSLVNGKLNAATSVKNQQATGTCWCFATTSLIESECIRKGEPTPDISEMFTVRNIYIEKAKNYILRQGFARFDEGGLGHDVIQSIAKYGAVPESAYTGLINGVTAFNHGKMVKELKAYLDSALKKRRPVEDNWLDSTIVILDKYMGAPPASFEYNGKTYTPQTYAKDVLKFDPDDYVGLTSFTHHPFDQRFVLEVPDNFSNGSYYNVPLNELVEACKTAVRKGYTVAWDADVSNKGWAMGRGYALVPAVDSLMRAKPVNPDQEETPVTQESRQRLFEELVTEDDHLMHITGIGQSPKGKTFFVVKNSWGQAGPYHGYLNVSEAYFANNTISVVIPKAALDKSLKARVSK